MYDTRWHIEYDAASAELTTFVETVEDRLSDVDGEVVVTNAQTVKMSVYNMDVDEAQDVFERLEAVAQEVYGVEAYRMKTTNGEATVSVNNT